MLKYIQVEVRGPRDSIEVLPAVCCAVLGQVVDTGSGMQCIIVRERFQIWDIIQSY